MAVRYTVMDGDTLAKIADRFGFRDERTIWNDPANAEIQALRPNPEVLLPGDVVVIPDKETRLAEAQTERRHVFRTRAARLKLRLRIEDRSGAPRHGLPVVFALDGDDLQATTDGSGAVERPVQPSTVHASISLPEERLAMQIGYLDPVDSATGWRARLNNLGYDAGDGPLGTSKERSALEEFQCDNELPITGVPGSATLQALLLAHGC